MQVSPRYVADVWRRHKEDILDPLNKDLYVSLQQKKRDGKPVMNQVLLCNGGNDYKLPLVGKLKIAAANGRAIPMRLPCRALIAGDHLNADAITAAMIVLSEQGAPARLFFIVHFFPCIFLIVVSPLPLLIATLSRRCRCHRRRASIVSIVLPPICCCPIAPPSSIAIAPPPSISRRLPPQQATIKMPQRPSSASSKRAPPTMSC